MGEFIPEAPAQETTEKKPLLITDLDELRIAYREFKFQVKEKQTNSHNMIIPLMNELFTHDKSRKHLGLVDALDNEITTKRWGKTDIGKAAQKVVDRINRYWEWSEDYFDYIEKCVDGFIRVAESSFAIIQTMQKRMIDLETQNKELMEYSHGESKGKPETPVFDRKVEMQRFRVELERLDKEYKIALETKDVAKISSAKGAIRGLARGDAIKGQIISDYFDSMAAVDAAKKDLSFEK